MAMTTGLRPETFEQLQLNAGVFLEGFAHENIADAGALKTALAGFIAAGEGVLGATRGGGSFECTPETRTIEADGMRYPFKGATVNDMWTVKMTGTLLEITPENFKRVFAAGEVTTDGAKTTVRVRTSFKDEDYIPHLCWVGDTSKGFVLIELDNALNLTGATFSFSDKGEGTLPFEFQAHQGSLEEQEYAPFRIVFFNEAA